jgi:hypothetical protein
LNPSLIDRAEELFVASNFSAILSEAAIVPLAKAVMRFGEKVVKIQTEDRDTQGGKVTIVTEKGEKLYYDEVVMTTPLGWLKQNVSAFLPPLPERLIGGIDGISVGHLEKVCNSF